MEFENRWHSLLRTTSEDVKRLTAVWRYSSIPVAVQENVAEHSFWVALYAVMIARKLGADRDVQGQVALEGLIHDLPECVTGDVVRPFKYSSQEFKQAVDLAEGDMVDTLPDAIREMLADSDEVRSEYVKAIVKAADFLSLFQYMRREAARGNLEIIPFYMKMVEDLGAIWRSSPKDVPMPQPADNFRPGPFYMALRNEALAVAKDCFHGLEEDPRWMRKV